MELGNRYQVLVKRELAKVKKEQGKIKDATPLEDKFTKATACEYLPKSLVAKADKVERYSDTIELKFTTFKIRITKASGMFNLPKDVIDLRAAKRKNCKEQEGFIEMLETKYINKFKAYVRAKYSKAKIIDALTDTQFEALFKEFVALKNPQSCSL